VFVGNISILEILFLSKDYRLGFRRKEKAMYRFRVAMLPSVLLIVLGSIDALTTVIGVSYFGAGELNPFLTGIVNTNITAFLVLKLAATFFIGFTYIIVNKTLNRTLDKTSKSYHYSNWIMKAAYTGLILFLAVVIANNFSILLA
jgi:hypothetical protein